MSVESFRYPPRALVGDYLRAALGVLLTAGPLLFVPATPVSMALLGGLACLFALFGVKTWFRQATVIELTADGIAARGPMGSAVTWRDLGLLKLGYYTTRRDRQGGWMQLTLASGGRRLRLDSALEGFERIVRLAADHAIARDLPLSSATRSNLLALGIELPGPDAPDASGTAGRGGGEGEGGPRW